MELEGITPENVTSSVWQQKNVQTFTLHKGRSTNILKRPTPIFDSCAVTAQNVFKLTMLTTNMKTHAGGTHQCIVKGCNKIFMYKKDLENHMKIHTGVGLIPCIHCNKQFTTNTAMRAHSKIHLNEVHNCATCGKSFSTKPYLLQHVQGKHGKGYIALCGAQYRWPKICTIMRNTAKTVFI